MRIRSITGLSAAALMTLAFATGGSAQQGPPKPAAEMSQVAYFEGVWTCTGKILPSPMGPAGDVKSTATIQNDLNGHFQSGTIKGTMTGQPPFEGRFNATYDTGSKQFVMLWVDNMGGWSQTTSSGWKGDVMIYEGDSHMAGQTMRSRDTFTKSGPTSMKHTWEAQMGGKWTPLGDETCTKK